MGVFLLVVGGVAILAAPSASAAHTNANCLDYVQTPLWVNGVEFHLVEGSPASFVQDSMAFLHPGDYVRVEFTLENRVPDRCSDFYNTMTPDIDRMQVLKWTDFTDIGETHNPEDWSTPDIPENGHCPRGSLNEPGGTCEVIDFLTVPDDASPGEKRVRYLAVSQGGSGNWRARVGVERVVVVDQQPDMGISEIEIKNEDSLYTTYNSGQNVRADFVFLNDGTYPNFDPNGGDTFWGRPAYDSTDDDLKPDFEVVLGDDNQDEHDHREHPYTATDADFPTCIGHDLSENGPPWNTAKTSISTGDQDDQTYLVCSYRRGAIFPQDFYTEVRDPAGERATRTSTLSYDSFQADKNDATAPDGTSDLPGQRVIDPARLAGAFTLNLSAWRDAQGWTDVPDPTHENNWYETSITVKGADLRITDASVSGLHEDGACGNSKGDPCDINGVIRIPYASFENVGDEIPSEHRAVVLEREWQAEAFINGQRVRQDTDGASTEALFDKVPESSAGSQSIWDRALQIDPLPAGGAQTVEIRLDHTDNYDDDDEVTYPVGEIGEITEWNQCPDGDDALDNVYCETIYFEDETTPTVSDLALDPGDRGNTSSKAYEGEQVTFWATVSDNSLAEVTALITGPDGETIEEDMDPIHPHAELWTTTRTFEGTLGNFTYRVRATDEFDHEKTSSQELDLTVSGLPKDIRLRALTINGQDGTAEDKPAYEGTADQAENWLRLEANVTGTGHDDPYETDGNHVRILAPNGSLAYEVPVDVYTVCDVWNTVTDSREDVGEGDECDDADGDDTTEVRNKRPRFYVDTRCASGEDPEENAGDCQDADGEAASAWSDITLDWIGNFNVTMNVTDVFDRTASEVYETGIQDVDGPPVLDEPEVGARNVTASQTLNVSAYAADGLRVEAVELEAVKPDGTTETVPLSLDPSDTEDDETRNGTYRAEIELGRFAAFDQAGTYNLTFTATDMAGKVATMAAGNVTLLDQTAPSIETFHSVPKDKQEIDGPVNVVAVIEDETALKTPVVTIVRPSTGERSYDLSYNASEKHYELEDPLTAAGADVGNWTLKLEVLDWASNSATFTDGLQVERDLPPQARGWEPSIEGPNGALYGPPQPTIQVDVVDYGDGVDRSSITLSVDGTEVSPQIQKIENGFTLSYRPSGAALSDGDPVTVSVKATDLSKPNPKTSKPHLHQFRVDAIGPSLDVSLIPSHTENDTTFVNREATIHLDATDDGSGTASLEGALFYATGGTVHSQTPVSIEPGGDPVPLDTLEGVSGHGTYTLSLTPEDRVGNEGDTVQHQFVLDAHGPRVEVFRQSDEPARSIYASIADEVPIEEARIAYKVDGDARDPVPMVKRGGNWHGKIPVQPGGSEVAFRVVASDVLGNEDSSAQLNYTSGNTPPTIRLINPTPGQILEDTVTLEWIARDLEIPDANLGISLSYKAQGDASFKGIPSASDLANDGQHTLDVTELPNGEIVLQIIATDGTTFNDTTVPVQVRNLDALFVDPRIDNLDTENGTPVVDPDSELAFSLGIDGPARHAWANVTRDGEQISSTTLTPDGDRWTGTIQAPGEAGHYEIDLAALTPDGSVGTAGAYAFEVQGSKSLSIDGTQLGILLVILATVGVVALGLRQRSRS